MKFTITLVLILQSIVSLSQRSSIDELKNQLVDSLKINQLSDSIFIIKRGCTGCLKSIRSPLRIPQPKSTCLYNETYFIYWIKNDQMYSKIYNHCFETEIEKRQISDWFSYYSGNFSDLQTIHVLEEDSILQINDNNYSHSTCFAKDTTEEFNFLGNYDYYQIETKIQGINYNSGKITNLFLCNSHIKNLAAIRKLALFFNLFAIEVYNFEYNTYENLKSKRLQNWTD